MADSNLSGLLFLFLKGGEDMRIDSMLMMIFVGLALGDRASRALGEALSAAGYMRSRGRSEHSGPAGRAFERGRRRSRPYLEKLARDYEIIPLMSKLV
jgi:hypothetical protein